MQVRGGGTHFFGRGRDVRLEILTTTREPNCKRTKFITHIQRKFSVLPPINKLSNNSKHFATDLHEEGIRYLNHFSFFQKKNKINKGLSLNVRDKKSYSSQPHIHVPNFSTTTPPDEIESIIPNFIRKLCAPYDLNIEPSEYERWESLET